jgi:polar amino acid transport system substrate-binding protein
VLIGRFLVALAIFAAPAAIAEAQTSLKAGVADIGAPFSFHDPVSNSDRGLMVDVLQQVSKLEGTSPQLQSMPFTFLIQSLAQGKIDVAVGTLAVTQTNQAQIDFSQKVFTDSDALIVPLTDTAKYTTYDDLKGKILGLQQGVVPLESLHTDLYPKVRIYGGGQDLISALAAGQVDVAIANRSIAGYLLKMGLFPTLQLVTTFKPTTFGDIAFGVKKGNAPLVAKLNDGLTQLKANGGLDTILKTWGVE